MTTTTTTTYEVWTWGYPHCTPVDTADGGWQWEPVTFKTLEEAVRRARMLERGTVMVDGATVWAWDDAIRPDDETLRDWLAETVS